jgi:signal transduction histidine kinase
MVQANPIFENGFKGYMGSILDITDQIAAEEATFELMRKKDEFMSIASHELRTPITSIKGAMQIVEKLADKQQDKTMHGFIVKANKQLNRLNEILGDLLDVTKIQQGQQLIKKSNFLIKDAVDECSAEVVMDNKLYPLSIEVGTDIVVCGDRTRIGQVLNNLVSNAMKYSPKGGKIFITVKKRHTDTYVAVADEGVGISDDMIPFVFDRYFRVEATSQSFPGIGLGLYISAEIIRQHGGIIGVESELGKGSKFWFTLPNTNVIE